MGWDIPFEAGQTDPITITLKSSDDTQFVWDQEVIEFVKNGEDAVPLRTLSLDNDFDTFVRNENGEAVASWSGPILVMIEPYLGADREKFDSTTLHVTPPTPSQEQSYYSWTQGYDYDFYVNDNGTGTLQINSVPKTFDKGDFTIQWRAYDSDTAPVYATKKFTLQAITALADYDLIIPQVVYNNSKEGTIKIIVLKNSSTNGVEVFEEPSNKLTEVKVFKKVGETEEELSTGWTISFGVGQTDPITVILKSSDGTITWDQEVIEFVKDGKPGASGTSPKTLALDNDFDSLVKDSTGAWISKESTVQVTAYQGTTRQSISTDTLTVAAPQGWTDQGENPNYTFTITGNVGVLKVTNPPNNFTGGEFTFTWEGANDTLDVTKKFKLQVITSLADYDLIVPQTVYNTKAEGNINVSVRKKSAGNTTILTKPSDDTNITISVENAEMLDNSWTIKYNAGQTKSIKITLKPNKNNTSFIWDQETVECVQDGKSIKGDSIKMVSAYYRSSSMTFSQKPTVTNATVDNPTPTSPELSPGWSWTPVGVTADEQYEYISTAEVVNNIYYNLTWTDPVLSASTISVNTLNVYNALTNNSQNKIMVHDKDTGNVYINATMINTGILTVTNDDGDPIFQAGTNENGKGVVQVGSWFVHGNQLCSTTDNGKNPFDKTASGMFLNGRVSKDKVTGEDIETRMLLCRNKTYSYQDVFYITSEGRVHAEMGDIGGWNLVYNRIDNGLPRAEDAVLLSSGRKNIGDYKVDGGFGTVKNPLIWMKGKFAVDETGKLYATGADISGKITVKENSTIAGWDIGQSVIKKGALGQSGSMWLCSDGYSGTAKIGNSPTDAQWHIAVGRTFGVDKNGKLYANGANISGIITATEGKIGNLTINTDGSIGLRSNAYTKTYIDSEQIYTSQIRAASFIADNTGLDAYQHNNSQCLYFYTWPIINTNSHGGAISIGPTGIIYYEFTLSGSGSSEYTVETRRILWSQLFNKI